MATPEPDTLLQLHTKLNEVKAAHTDLLAQVRNGALVDVDKLEALTVARAHRIRDQLLTAPSRHAALLASRFSLDAALVNAALVRIVRATLEALAKSRD